ncbi:hypothetical protein FRB95_013899 [Tulasnella sp. JGI-2019a]|nr:hypothetical protein FRB95_013899 [Tulasnella sp. JGI-2019a]
MILAQRPSKPIVFTILLLASNPVAAAYTIASSTLLGNAAQTGLTRDSCTTSRYQTTAALWTCRDTQPVTNGIATLPVVSNSAAWSTISTAGVVSLTQTGAHTNPFFPIPADQCSTNTAGVCSDGTRWPTWPDSPVLVTIAYPNGDTGGFTWINNQHISGLSQINSPASVSMYYVEYQPVRDGANLPQVTLWSESWWASTDDPYGVYGNVVVGSTAYLYALREDGTVSLAQVPAASIIDQTKYQYWVNGAWTTTKPARGASGSAIPNASAGGQGTYYYSTKWAKYVWIGGSIFPGATWYMTTASSPQGPWAAVTQLFSAKGGNYGLSAYSCVAHPALTDGTGNDIYLSFTNLTADASGGNALYTTPLYHIVWN